MIGTAPFPTKRSPTPVKIAVTLWGSVFDVFDAFDALICVMV